MKSRLYLWSAMAGSRSLTIAALMLGGIACGYSPVANGGTAASADNHSLDGFEMMVATEGAIAPSGLNACLTWSDYQTYHLETTGEVIPTYLRMPQGFQKGCVFQTGFSLANPVYILRDGLDFAAISRTDASLTDSSTSAIPRFEGFDVNYDTIDALIQQGDLLVYANACTTTGRYLDNCEGFPQDRPYLLRELSVCFQGNCLEGGNLSREQRLALWSGYSEATEANGLTTEQVSARHQYEEISLESLFSALPVIVKNDESLAFEMFGRSQPQEGEQETVIETVGTYENYRVLQLTNLGAADDSIGGQRYRFEFEYFDNDQLNLVWVGQQRYCRHTTPPQWTHERCP
ncbi:hypothetical protein GS597_07595 [Synechococcales cyanobacterium C]|uniref:Lipoprotein n=1 Tax=Petrachloros mirabilis ULC683 TaxID=2781853 RepID=A0A8K1ZW76_9CYAN|nr:hypothetical protein [Petrachloros mirabilis]NCJ06375.1 hypothetical protein [Petrachloros mirabilis ULC683]